MVRDSLGISAYNLAVCGARLASKAVRAYTEAVIIFDCDIASRNTTGTRQPE